MGKPIEEEKRELREEMLKANPDKEVVSANGSEIIDKRTEILLVLLYVFLTLLVSILFFPLFGIYMGIRSIVKGRKLAGAFILAILAVVITIQGVMYSRFLYFGVHLGFYFPGLVGIAFTPHITMPLRHY